MSDVLDVLLPICYGELALTGEQIRKLTIYEIVNMYHGYIIRHRTKENLLAQFVTIWVANTAGKMLKQELTMKQLFRDGRFIDSAAAEELQEILQECYE